MDVTNFSPSIAWAGGGIISTTSDVTAFYRALLEGRLLPAALMAQIMTTVVDDKNGKVYGLGIEKKEFPCGTAWGHPGNFPGYFMESHSTADARKQVTVAYNFDSTSMGEAEGQATIQVAERRLLRGEVTQPELAYGRPSSPEAVVFPRTPLSTE